MAKPSPIDGLSAELALEVAARRAITVRLGDVRRYEPEVRGRYDVDAVHDMRVATRRLRAALALFDRRGQLAAAEELVAELGDALGQARDLQLQLAWLGGAIERRAVEGRESSRPSTSPTARGTLERRGIAELAAELRAALPPALQALDQALARWQDEGATRVAAAGAALATSGSLGGRRMRRRLRRRIARADERLRATLASNDAHTAHRLRIAAKKLRYDTELLEPALPEVLDPFLERLPALQELLGDLHDCDVRLPLVERFLERAAEPEVPGAVGLLREELVTRQRLGDQLGVELTHWHEEALLPTLWRRLRRRGT